MENQNKKNAITEGAIGRQLLLFFFPILFGSFFQQLYNTADAVIVGRYVGKEALAAVGGTTGTIINLFVGFFIGLSSGFSVIIAQHYGAKHDEAVEECVHTALAFAAVSGLALTAAGIFGSAKALSYMQVPDDILPNAVTYLTIYFAGMIPNLVYNMGASILRAAGDSKKPLYFLIISCFANIALDIIFVVKLSMGVRGAAIATILCQSLSAVMVLVSLMRTKLSYRFIPSKLHINMYHLKKMVYIGIAAGLQSAMYTIANILIQASVNSLGTDTIAAWTAYGKIDTLFWMTIQSLGISVTTFTGQNYGAGLKTRVKNGIRTATFMAIALYLIVLGIFLGFGKYGLMLFTSDLKVIEIGLYIIRFMIPMCFFYLFIEIYSSALRGIGDCWIPTIMTSLGVCALRIVWMIFAFPTHRDMKTVLFSYPLSWIITSLLFIIYMHGFSQMHKWLKSA